MSDLGRRAVACKGWQWMPGMRTEEIQVKGRPGESNYERVAGFHTSLWGCLEGPPKDITPDLEDPATLGCLLALVREAWGMPFLTMEPQPLPSGRGYDGWASCVIADGLNHVYDTEAEALVAALEAAP